MAKYAPAPASASAPSLQQLAVAGVTGHTEYQMVSWDLPAATGQPESILRNRVGCHREPSTHMWSRERTVVRPEAILPGMGHIHTNSL